MNAVTKLPVALKQGPWSCDPAWRRDNEGRPAGAAERRLTAILMADVAGYSRLVGADEYGTLRRWRAHWDEFIAPTILAHHGRIARINGDGILTEFASAVNSVECAVALQSGMRARNADIAAQERIEFRIGINIGDVIIDRGDMWGEGVNMAARLQALAEPGGLCVSAPVQDVVANKIDIVFEDLGPRRLKNIARTVRIYRARLPSNAAVKLPLARAAAAPDQGSAPSTIGFDLRTAARGIVVPVTANALVSLLIAGAWWLALSPSPLVPPHTKGGFVLASEARPATGQLNAPVRSIVALPRTPLPPVKQ